MPSWLGSSFPEQPQTLLTKEEARQEIKTLTVLTSTSNSLVDLFQFTSQVIKNLVHLQSSIQERSQDDLWPGGIGSRLVCGGQSRSDGTL